ncbi:hypothetical protein Tco_0303342 [Tanacetum coccineum]
MGLPEDIYAAVDSYETAQEIWLRVQQMMIGSEIGTQEKKAKLFNEWERFTSTDGESIESYYHRFSKLMNNFKRNKHFLERLPTTSSFLTTYNQNGNDMWRQIAQPGMNMAQDRHMQMVGVQNVGNQVGQNVVQNPSIQNVGNQNGLIVVPRIANKNTNQNWNGNVVAARAEGNANGNNGNQVRCFNCRGMGHLSRNYTVTPRRMDVAYLQTQLLIAQKEEVEIQLQAEEFDLMVAVGDIDEIEEVNANCILMANLQEASTSGTKIDKALVYDSDGSAKVHQYENYYNNDIFSMFTQKEHMEHSGGTVEQHPATIEETRAYFQSLYNNLVTKVKKVNTVNRKIKEMNAHLTIELARYRGQEISFEINKANFDELETTLNEEIANLNNYLSKEKSTISLLQKEKKKLNSDFKTREDELLDKLIQSEKKIKELDNILIKTGQSIQTMHMLSPKPDSFYHTE